MKISKPDLSDEGLKIWKENLEIIFSEFKNATGKDDETECDEIFEWMKENKEFLKTKLHPNTAFFQ